LALIMRTPAIERIGEIVASRSPIVCSISTGTT